MKKKLLSDISASSLQVMINQLCGLLIFYILSTRLSKEIFGELNWTLAVLLTAFSILSFGIDQVMVKKIAASEDNHATLGAFSMHVIITGLLLYLLLFAGWWLVPSFFDTHNFLLLLAFGKVLLFFSSPFKQLANGLEQFRPLLFMSTVSNIVRAVSLLVLLFIGEISTMPVLLIFVAGDIAEFIVCIWITKHHLKMPIFQQWNTASYKSLLKESLPQTGVVLFTAALSRFDWIFLGLFSSTVILANYSFAYKVFEVSLVPLLVIAPVLIPRFTKISRQPGDFKEKKPVLQVLLRYEIIIACLVALVLQVIWVPAVDFITDGKYGAVNKQTILLLASAMPFLYFNNFLWSICFTKGDLKAVFRIFLACFIVNIAGILISVPFYNAEGAAASYLASIILQSVLFERYHRRAYRLSYHTGHCLLIVTCAFIAGFTSHVFLTGMLPQLAAAMAVFIALLFLSGSISKKDGHLLKQVWYI
ncbi:MAG: oligosaccharide flippase family protein [Ferruginibacter sp.]